MNNRSVPSNSIVAHVTYEEIEAAASWLCSTLGFAEQFRYGEPVAGLQLRRGDVVLMLNRPSETRRSPWSAGGVTQYLTLVVADVDRVHAHVQTTGSRIREALNETPYGERQFVVVDPEGHPWLISQHVQDVSPESWGAVVPPG